MNEISYFVYTLEELFYDNTNMTLKSLINSIYYLDGLEYFDSDEYSYVFFSKKRTEILDVYKLIISEFKYEESITLRFVCGHKKVAMVIKMIDRCVINPINSTVNIINFKEVTINE